MLAVVDPNQLLNFLGRMNEIGQLTSNRPWPVRRARFGSLRELLRQRPRDEVQDLRPVGTALASVRVRVLDFQ